VKGKIKKKLQTMLLNIVTIKEIIKTGYETYQKKRRDKFGKKRKK